MLFRSIALNNTVNGSIWVSAVQPVHQDDVTGLTNRLAQIEGNTNFSSLYVTNDSEFNSKITVNDLAASEIHSSARPSTSVLALIETDGLITDSAIATTNIATLDDVRAATNGISASSVNDTNVIFADVTGGNATTSKHGYLQKLNGSTSQYLRGDGTWGVPTGLVVPDGNPFHTVNGEGVWESVSEG